MKAVILAGGRGTRLAPYTTVFPKPLVPIGERPILDLIIRQLSYYGFKEVVLSVGYLAELIQAYFSTGNNIPDKIALSYVREKKPMGTAASLALVPDLNDTFLVMNGDILTTLNYCDLIRFHKEKGGVMTIAMHQKSVKIDLGVILFNEQGEINGYMEKPQYDYSVSMGIYVYEPRILEYIKQEEYLDFPDLVLRLLDRGERIIGYPSNDFWLDIGRQEDYQMALVEFDKRREEFHCD